MKKYPLWFKLTLVAGVLAGLLVTSAARFLAPSVNTHNGLVYSYSPGKSLTIRGWGREPIDYILNSKTLILPASLAGSLAAGNQVTVYAQCFSTHATSGCLALTIYINSQSTGTGSSSGGTGSSSGGTVPVASPTAPVATPTP